MTVANVFVDDDRILIGVDTLGVTDEGTLIPCQKIMPLPAMNCAIVGIGHLLVLHLVAAQLSPDQRGGYDELVERMPTALDSAMALIRSEVPKVGKHPDDYQRQVILCAGWSARGDDAGAMFWAHETWDGGWQRHDLPEVFAHPDHPSIAPKAIAFAQSGTREALLGLMREQLALDPKDWPDLMNLEGLRRSGQPLGGGRAVVVEITRQGMALDSHEIL